MATAKAIIIDLYKKAGGDVNSEDYKGFLSGTALDAIDIPDSLSGVLNTGLMDESGARNNPKIKTHFISQFSTGIEASYFKTLKELGATDEDIETIIASDKSTGQRLSNSKAVLEKLLHEAKKSSGKEGNDEMKRLLKEAQDKYTLEKSELSNKILTLEGQRKADAMDRAYEKHFGKLTIKGVEDPMIRNVVLKAKMDEWFAESGAKLEFDETKKDFLLKNATSPDLDYMHEGKAYSFSEFLSFNLQKNNLLDPKPGGSGNGDPNHVIPQGGNPGGTQKSIQQQVAETNKLFEMPGVPAVR